MNIFSLLAKLGGSYLEGHVEKTKAKAKAEAQVMVQSSKSIADWEALQARNAGQSWKDEWLTILFSIPLILAFIPDTVPYVMLGFEALELMPEWYRYSLTIIVGASFGVRSVIGIMKTKK
jgi:hypothetical protein|nr:Protein of unknown function (DUF3154) [uncultured Mediterranean phage uvMED]